MLRTPIFRPLWLPVAIITMLLLTTIGAMVTMSWRNLQRLQPVHKHLTVLNQLQQIRLSLDEVLEPALTGKSTIDIGDVKRIDTDITELAVLNTHLDPDTPRQLSEASKALESNLQHPKDQLLTALSSIRAVLAAEYQAHDKLMNSVRSDTKLEFKTATSLFIILPLLAFGLMFLLRHQIFEPLSELATLMRLLARQDFKPAASSTVGPLLKPLFDNYNHMVSRLAKLEQQSRTRQASLENQVRTATHALLEQQRGLAAAERLAAVGELSAGLAHELRNPLAGMQIALNNLRQEIDNTDHDQRLKLIVNELNRITALLNSLLSQAQQEPERSVEVKVGKVIRELATLASYQIGENIRLKHRVADNIKCRLPASRMHQALLNLILNAAQAIDEENGTIVIVAENANNQLILTDQDSRHRYWIMEFDLFFQGTLMARD